jgi:threonyl-tRNA synthetase
VQIQIITISEKHNKYGTELEEKLKQLNIRVKTDYSDNTIGKKIRIHRKMRPAYMAIIGDEESKNKTVSIRGRNGKQRNGIPVEEFLEKLILENTTRSKELNLI